MEALYTLNSPPVASFSQTADGVAQQREILRRKSADAF